MGKHSSPGAHGTVAIIAGAAIALGGGTVLVHGLTQDDSTEPAYSAASGTGSPTSSGPTSPDTGRATTSSARRHTPSKSGSKHTSKPATSKRAKRTGSPTTVPEPKSNSKLVEVANAAGAACIPKHLTVSSVGIDERVVPMGTNAQGQIYPPAHTTMWYNRSTQPGQAGISVIAGHVTYDGPDNFYNLRNVPVGAKVTVRCTNDKSVRLQVTHKESILKTKLTTDQRVWGGSSTPVVTLITCDIKSQMVSGHHVNNYVVWTKPA